MRRKRIGAEKIAMQRVRFAFLREIEFVRFDHRDVVVRTSNLTVRASDALVILEINFALGPSLDGASRTRAHAFGIVAMPAGAGDQKVVDLDAGANQAA